jgi:hypothetical protein
VFVTGTPLRPSLMFVSLGEKGWILPNVKLMTLPTDTLAYYEHSYITDVDSLITLGPGENVIKSFRSVIYKWLLKAVPGKPYHFSVMFVGEARNLP